MLPSLAIPKNPFSPPDQWTGLGLRPYPRLLGSGMFRITTLAFATTIALAASSLHAEENKEFSNAVIDLGIVVKDLEKSATFYKDVVGLKELPGFEVPGQVTGAFGLTDNQDVKARIFSIDGKDGRPSTKLKMMAFPKAPGVKSDQKFIHSTLGFSYLTLFVTDMDAAMERLKKAGVKTLGKTPASIGGKNKLTVFRDPDGNFIELIGPSSK